MSWGAVGGAAASVAIGSLFGGDEDGGGQTQVQQTSANPFTAGGGLFTTNFGPGVRPGTISAAQNLSPEDQQVLAQMQALAGQQVSTTTRGGSTGPTAGQIRQAQGKRHPDEFLRRLTRGNTGTKTTTRARGLTPEELGGLSPEVLAAFQASQGGGGGSGQAGLDMGITDPRLAEINSQGLFGANQFLDQSINNQSADRAGELGLGFLNQLGETDPLAIAQNQFDLLNPILQDQQNQDFLGQEQRLFAQGRLGGAGELGGQAQQNALFDAQQDSERKLLFDSFGLGLQSQAQTANLASQFSQLDPAIRGSFQNLGTNMLNIPLQLQQAMLQQAQVAGGLSGATNTANLSNNTLSPTQTIGAGLINSGVNQLGNITDGLFRNPSQDFSAFAAGNNDVNGFTNTVGR